MGLRLVAHYYDRTEALIARSVLADAGFLALIPNEDVLRLLPRYTMAFGGYRLLVCDCDLEDAVVVLREAVANPLNEGEELVVTGDFLDRVLGLFMGFMFAGGAPVILRRREWRDAPQDGHELR